MSSHCAAVTATRGYGNFIVQSGRVIERSTTRESGEEQGHVKWDIGHAPKQRAGAEESKRCKGVTWSEKYARESSRRRHIMSVKGQKYTCRRRRKTT
jgi:hypothetical protein